MWISYVSLEPMCSSYSCCLWSLPLKMTSRGICQVTILWLPFIDDLGMSISPWNLLGTYITILDSKQNCVLISIPVKSSRQALPWPYLKDLQFSCSAASYSLRPHGLLHARLLCPSSTPRACSSSCPSSQWCHPTILTSVIPFSSRLHSFLASGSFPMSQM